MLRSFMLTDEIIDKIVDKIIPKQLNPLSGLSALGKLKDYFAQARIAAIILGVILVSILIALIVLIIKKNKKR